MAELVAGHSTIPSGRMLLGGFKVRAWILVVVHCGLLFAIKQVPWCIYSSELPSQSKQENFKQQNFIFAVQEAGSLKHRSPQGWFLQEALKRIFSPSSWPLPAPLVLPGVGTHPSSLSLPPDGVHTLPQCPSLFFTCRDTY